MHYIYRGDSVTYHPTLGRLVPGEVAKGPDALVAPVVASGLIEAVADAAVDPLRGNELDEAPGPSGDGLEGL